MAVASKRSLQICGPTVGSYLQPMCSTRSWATLLLVHAASSLLSIHPVLRWSLRYSSNGHHWYPYARLGSSYGNHSIGLSMQFHWPATMLIWTNRTCDWRCPPTNQPPARTVASSSNTPSINRTPMTLWLLDQRSYPLMGCAQHSMPVQIPTSSKPTLISSSITTVTHTSEPSHPTNSFVASTSSTNSLTGFLNHHKNSALTLLCLLARPSGYLSKSTHIWCISKMPTVSCSCHINLPRQQLWFKHLSMARLEFGYPQKINGSRHTPTILRCALSVTSSQTHPKSVTQH